MVARSPIAWVAAGLLAGSVLVFDPWGWAAFGPIKWLWVTVGAAGLLAVVLTRPRVEAPRAALFGWAAFLLWGGVASLVAVDPLHTWIGTPDRHLGLLAWSLFAVVFVAGLQLRARSDVFVVLRAAVVALGGVGLYACLEWTGLPPVDLGFATDRFSGPFGNPAYLGAACALLLPIAAGVAADDDEATGWRWVAGGAVAVGLVAVIGSQTRAAWLGLLVAGVFALPAAAHRVRMRRLPVIAGIAVGVVVVVVLTPVGGRLVDAFGDDGAARGRLDEWRVAGGVLVNHPVTGAGFEGYRIVFSEAVDDDYERRYTRQVMPDRAHNGPLDVAVTTGLPGAALYLAAAAWLVVHVWRGVRSGEAWLAGVSAGVIGYLAQQQFLFPLVEIDPAFWIIAGVLVAATGPVAARRAVPIPRGVWLVAVGLGAVALVAGGLDMAADHETRTAVDRGQGPKALAAADDATDLRPDSIRYWFIAATIASRTTTPAGQEAALARLDQALDLSPHDPILLAEHASVRLQLARVTGGTGELQQAITEWRDLVATDPHHARYQLELGVALALNGDADEAETAWKRAEFLAPASPVPAANLALLYAESGRSEEAVAALGRAAAIDPTNPVVIELGARLAREREGDGG